jgi:hypothetical protein
MTDNESNMPVPTPEEIIRAACEETMEQNPATRTITPGGSGHLAKEPDLIRRFSEDVEQAGLVGERENAATVFLCALSAKLPNPLNLTVQGASSSGKNYLLARAASFIPDEMKRFLSGMTPKVLMHAAEDEFEHKVVFVAEYEGVARADYAIRTFQSEQVIEWQFVETTQDGIRNRTRKVRGPAAFIQATTRPLLHPENETRLLFIQMDETSELTEAILWHQAEEAATGSRSVTEDLCAPWHELIRGLKLTEVIVPFAEKLVPYFPSKNVRSRRDFPKLLGLIQACAFLNQHQRDRDGNAVLADSRDYDVAKPLFEHSYSSGPDEVVAELLKEAKWLEEYNGGDYGFSVVDLIGRIRWGKSKTYKVLNRAEELGCIAETKRGVYRFLRSSLLPPLNLPEKVTE